IEDLARLLVEYGADVNVLDNHNNTPLSIQIEEHWGQECKNSYDQRWLNFSKILLVNGANIEREKIAGSFYSVASQCTQKLLELGPSIFSSHEKKNFIIPTFCKDNSTNKVSI